MMRSVVLFRFDSQLDMRMNRSAKQTAADILNSYDEEQLANLFYLYGELEWHEKLLQQLFLQKAKRSQ